MLRTAPRIVALAAAALLCSLLGSPGAAYAHGSPDQFLQFGPGCLQSVLKASAPSTGPLRQEFVPSSTELSGVDVCLTTASTSTVNLSVRAGTAASPGAVLATASTAAPASANAWVHLELGAALPTTPGTTYVIEISGFPTFEWRGTCGEVAGACTAGDIDDYPYDAGVSSALPAVADFGFITYIADVDFDGVLDSIDNCISLANPGQENDDANFIELGGYRKVYDDKTWPNADAAGNACDSDDDNDELSDATELALPGPACPTATGPLDPLLRDTDGDEILDGAECALGAFGGAYAVYNPNVANNIYNVPVADDPDNDDLPTALENTIGSNPNAIDTDGDKLQDGPEYRGYNGSPAFTNTDGDLCNDAKEAASINGDTKVDVIDLQQVAQQAGTCT